MVRLFCLSLLSCLLAGCGIPSFLVTPVQNTNELEASVVEPGQGLFRKKVAVIGVEGMLIDVQSGGFLQPTENPLSLFVQQLDAAERDPSVVAVVLRINSPGGTVTTSDTMYQRVLRFRQKTHKPVVAATQDVAASGAYYIACAADKIVAHPTSVVGSIGVIFYSFDVEGTLGKIGARTYTFKSGPFKDLGSPFRSPTPADRALMQSMVDDYHRRFVSIVTTHRTISDPTKFSVVTDGRVFSGEEARELGLVDATGTLEDAIALAKTLAKAPNADTILYRRPYGYGGSIYARHTPPPPGDPQSLKLDIPGASHLLPTGFYYLWQP